MSKNIDIWQYLRSTDRPIVLYGMGNGAEAVLAQLERIGKRAVGVFASDGFVRGQNFCGYIVSHYSDLLARYPEMIILVCFGSNRPEVLSNIEELSQSHTVLCPDVPVYGDNVFDYAFAKKHAKEITAVYNLLADDESRKVYRQVIEFKLSGKTEKLRFCQFDGGLFDLVDLSDQETYVDLGAYRGDTVQEFIKCVNGYNEIFAFEPNAKTYAKLCDNVNEFDNVHCINMAVADFNGVSQIFSAGRGSSINKKGREISVCSLDSYFSDERISLIKMDVEGQEREALLGAVSLIKRCCPKLIVATYHRSEDIFSLPLLVHKIHPDYKIHVRHFPHNLAWDTNFYFI